MLVLLALLGTAAGTVWIVSYALRPCVGLPGGRRGCRASAYEPEHRITARVAESDTDPGNEVGIVGNTLNRLLANVDGALADLAASDRRMRQFLADASHELRTRWRRSWDTPS